MQKLIQEVDKENGYIQITVADERWYVRQEENEETGNPEYRYVPSVTRITSYYPKGVEFYKWLAKNGWDESQAIKQAAGDKGTKVHAAITELLNGEEVAMESQFLNPSTNEREELTLEEYECLMTFVDWYREYQPTVIENELPVWNDEYDYAGMVDLVAYVGEQPYIIDFKTSQNIWPEHQLQLAAYKQCLGLDTEPTLATLQLGYQRNKRGWKFTEHEDRFDLFLAARQIWLHEASQLEPPKRDYPMSLSLAPKQTKKRSGNNSKKTYAAKQKNNGKS